MLRTVLCLCIAGHLVSGQIENYNVVGNFSCDRTPELVTRTGETGTVRSPCYDGSSTNYPEELTSGFKLINITYDSPFLQGYQLTFRDFQLADSDRLYVGDRTEEDGLNTLAARNITFTSNATSENSIFVQTVEDGPIAQTLTLGSDNTYLLNNFKTVIIDFYTIDDTVSGRGFLIDYVADINKCLFTGDAVYCKNGGACSWIGFDSSACDCTGTGYSGTICTVDVNECSEGTHNCSANANCTNIDGGFTCTCQSGYSGNGFTCVDIDECAIGTHECAATGTCRNKGGGYDCDCNSGYENGTGGPCSNIDECARGTDDCDSNATCADTVGSYTCTCNTYYTGNGTTCVDIDECAVSTDPCGATGTCANKINGFDCTCNPGYENGTDGPCSDIDECGRGTDDCDVDAEASCTNNVGSFTCACKTGYTGDGKNCTDVDECTEGSDDCGADAVATCTNTVGSFTCACKTGFTGDGKTCTNIDECTAGTDNCHVNATCTDNTGSFSCACKTGFTGSGTSCSDNDECALDTDDCHDNATCTNTLGSFDCACVSGYAGDGKTCTEINECTVSNPCHADATCTNEPPGSFTCVCKQGYSGNGTYCEDFDECTANTDSCDDDARATCTNTKGSYTCKCKTGYTGDGKTCSDIDECTTGNNNCDKTNGVCNNNDGSYTCACKSGYQLKADAVTCEDIDECATSADNCTASESRCNNLLGSFECICNTPEYRGTPGNCAYYCLHNTTCIQDKPGFIDIPLNHDGTLNYEAFAETSWNFGNSTTGNGIRFTFKSFSTERRDDFLSIYPGDSVDIPKEIVGVSGIIGDLYNEKDPVTSSGYIQRTASGVTAYLNLTGPEVTLTLSATDVFLIFTSDRLNTSTGFLLGFEYDKQDCPAVSRCENGGTCEDRAFAYQCVGCVGYEGVDCDIDINECMLPTFPCDVNADCTNTNGSFTCACKTDYTGDGKTCNPLIVLSNYSVQKTTSSLSISFDITEAWKSADYIGSFIVTVVEAGEVSTRTFDLNITELLSGPLVVSGLKTYTEYSVTVAVNVTGSKFGSSVVRNDLGTQSFFTEESTPGTPTNVMQSNALRDRVTITWTKPAEAGFGKVTHYQICYAPSSSTRTQTVADLRSVTKTDTCMYLDDTYTSITLVGLPGYIDLDFKIRAYSSKGAGSFSTATSAYTGSICPQWTSYAARAPCNLREGLLLSDGFPRTVTESDNVVIYQYWSFDMSAFPGARPRFLFFRIVDKEATLDYGFGNADITDHDTEKENRVNGYSGNFGVAGPMTAIVRNASDINQNTLWFAFISDRTRKQTGFQVEIEVDGDSCYSSPCLHGGICSNAQYAYNCDCTNTNWRGASCEIPYVIPTVTCTPGKTSASVLYSVAATWASDETVIGGYQVEVTQVGSTVTTMDKTLTELSAMIPGLSPYTTYTIRVTPKSSIRTSVELEPRDLECQTLEDVPSEPRNVNVNSGDKSLVVTWDAPATPNGDVKYIVSWNSTDHGTYSESEQSDASPDLSVNSYTIGSLRDYRMYNVIVTAKTSAGTTAASAVSGRTNPGAPPAFSTASVTVIPNRSARVEWTFSSPTYIGPITVKITPISAIHTNAPTADVSVTGPPYAPTTYTYTSLEEDQMYNFTIVATTGTAPDQTRIVTGVNTNASAPGLPATFTYDRDTSTFSWTPPAPLDLNGVLTGYKLSSTSSVPNFTTVFFNPTDTSYQLVGLPDFTKYNFTLQARNSEGDGLERTIEITTKEGVPNTPDPPTQGATTKNSITVSWVAQDPPAGETTYSVTYTDGTTSVTFGTAQTQVTLTGLKPYTEYTITIVAITNAGSAAATTAVKFRTAEDVPTAVKDLAATFTPYQIVTTWNEPDPANGMITQYTFEWSASGHQAINVTETNYTLTGVTKSEHNYTIEVSAWTSAGQGPVEKLIVTTPKLLPTVPRSPAVTEITFNSSRITVQPPDNADSIAVENYVITISQVNTDCVSKKDNDCLTNKQYTTSSPTFVIPDLQPYRKYIVAVEAVSQGGTGPSTTNVTFDSLAGTPSAPTFTTTQIPGGVTVNIAAGSPFNGPASYIVTVTEGNNTFTQTVSETAALDGMSVNITGLSGSTTYTVSVMAVSNQGNTGSASNLTITTTPAAPTFTIESTTSTSLTVKVTADPTAVNYTYSYVKVPCDGSSCTPQMVTVNAVERVLGGLEVYTNYSVSVYVTSAQGIGETATMYQRTRVGQPTLVDPAYKLAQVNATDATSNFRAAYNVLLRNLCLEKGAVFVETQGSITKVSYFVRQRGSNEFVNQSLTSYYGATHDVDPSPLWIAFTVTCNTTSRRKRSVVNEGVIIGADSTCADGGTAECNGPLKPGTAYRFEACGFNEDNNYVCTNPTEEYTTAAAPGLTAGEIAAIVICSILFVILVILLIVYIVKRRRSHTGKARVSRRGKSNPSFEAKPSTEQQQKYTIDPAAEPQTEYTGTNA